MSKYIDLDSLKEYNTQMKTKYIDPLDNRVDVLEDYKVEADGTSILNDQGVLRLNSKYADYLAEVTFEKPSIGIFELDVDKDLFEIGETISVRGLSHMETNIENIQDSVITIEYMNSESELTSQDIEASNTRTNFTFEEPHTITKQDVNTIKYKLKGVDTRNNIFKKECNINVYIPSFIGALSDTLTDPQTQLTKKATTSLNGTHSIPIGSDGGYIYLVTTSTISKITDTSSGFDAEWSKIGTMNVDIENDTTVTKNYNVYRTIKLGEGTYSLKIS